MNRSMELVLRFGVSSGLPRTLFVRYLGAPMPKFALANGKIYVTHHRPGAAAFPRGAG